MITDTDATRSPSWAQTARHHATLEALAYACAQECGITDAKNVVVADQLAQQNELVYTFSNGVVVKLTVINSTATHAHVRRGPDQDFEIWDNRTLCMVAEKHHLEDADVQSLLW